MALLKYNKRDYRARSLKAKLIFEAKLTKRLIKLFREYSSSAYQVYLVYGLPQFSQEFQYALRDVLFNHYISVGKYFGSFHKIYKVKQKKAVSNVDSIVKRKLEDYYDELASKRVGQIVYTTEIELRKYVNTITQKTTEDGYSLDKRTIARAIKDILDKRAGTRAALIAVGETNGPAEKAKEIELETLIEEADDDDLEEMLGPDVPSDVLESVLAMGGAAALAAGLISVQKTWNATLDSSTRPEHAEADGQSVDILDNFDVGGESLAYPGDDSGSPENTINCRCEVTYDV